ncbi:MAG: hypothetical protein LPH19_13940, partial [Shewanella sp.]|nr:hypothetical protein [Shewanella sp.]
VAKTQPKKTVTIELLCIFMTSSPLRKVRTSSRTALAYEQKRVRGIQIKEGELPFKAEYQSNRDCSKAP